MERRARRASDHADARPTSRSVEGTALMPYVWSYGMGAESTAAIFRMLSNPAARPDTIAPDFSNLIVVIASPLSPARLKAGRLNRASAS